MREKRIGDRREAEGKKEDASRDKEERDEK